MPNVPSYDHVERQIGDPGLTADVVAMSLQVEKLTLFINGLQTLSPAPTITQLLPEGGPAGTQITLVGTDLETITGLTLSGVPITSFQAISSTRILATIPVGVTTGNLIGSYPQGQIVGPLFSLPNPVPVLGNVVLPAQQEATRLFTMGVSVTDDTGIRLVEFFARPLGTTSASEQFLGATTLEGNGLYQVNTSLPTLGSYQIRAKATDSLGEVAYSPYSSIQIIALALDQAAAPTVLADDTANLLQASAPTEADEVEVSENSGPWLRYTGPIQVGNNARPQGYWKFRTKATPTQLASQPSLSPSFSAAVVTASPIQNISLIVPGSITVNQTVGLSASAQSVNGITSARFQVDGIDVGTDTTAPYGVSYTPATIGTKQIKVIFTDSSGATRESVLVPLPVTAPVLGTGTPPTFTDFQDTEAGGSVRIVPPAGTPLSLIRYYLPGSSVEQELPEDSDGTVSVSNVTGSIRAFTMAGAGNAASAESSSPPFTVYTAPAPPPSYNTSITGIAPNETADGVEMTVADGVNLIMRWNAPLPTGDISPASTAVFYNGSQLAAVYFNAAPGVLGTACEFEYQGITYQKVFSTSDIVLA